MNRFTIASASMLSLLIITSPALAQSRWSGELRAGINVPADKFASGDLKVGPGLEMGLGVRVANDLFVYTAWDWQNRAAKGLLFGATVDVEDTGYALGLRYVVPVSGGAKPWVRAGMLLNHVEIEDEDTGDLVADSKHRWGFEVGGGFEMALSDRWNITPGVRYRRFEPHVRFGGARAHHALSYFVVDVGFALKF